MHIATPRLCRGVISLQCNALQLYQSDYNCMTGSAASEEGPAAAPPLQTAQTSNPISLARSSSESWPDNVVVRYIIRVRRDSSGPDRSILATGHYISGNFRSSLTKH